MLEIDPYHPGGVGVSRRLIQAHVTELLKADAKVVHGWGFRVTGSSVSGRSGVPASLHVPNHTAALLTGSLLMQDLALNMTELHHLHNIISITLVSGMFIALELLER